MKCNQQCSARIVTCVILVFTVKLFYVGFSDNRQVYAEDITTLSIDELYKTCGADDVKNEEQISFRCARKLCVRWLNEMRDEDLSNKIFSTTLRAAEKLSKTKDRFPTFELYDELYQRVETSSLDLKNQWALSCLTSAKSGHPFSKFPLDKAVAILSESANTISSVDEKRKTVEGVINAAELYLKHNETGKSTRALVNIQKSVIACDETTQSLWAKSFYLVALESSPYDETFFTAEDILMGHLNQDQNKELAYNAAVSFIEKKLWIDRTKNNLKIAANRLCVLMRQGDLKYKEKCTEQVIRAAEIINGFGEYCYASNLLSHIGQEVSSMRNSKRKIKFALAVLKTRPCEGGSHKKHRDSALSMLERLSESSYDEKLSIDALFTLASYYIESQAYKGPKDSNLRSIRNKRNIRGKNQEPKFIMTAERRKFHQSAKKMIEIATSNKCEFSNKAAKEVIRAAEIMVEAGVEGDKSCEYLTTLLSNAWIKDDKIKLKCAEIIFKSRQCRNRPKTENFRLAWETLTRLANSADSSVSEEAKRILSHIKRRK